MSKPSAALKMAVQRRRNLSVFLDEISVSLRFSLYIASYESQQDIQFVQFADYFGGAFAPHYIVYMGHHSHPDSDSVVTANHNMLSAVIGSSDGAKEVALHHYTKSFRGFSAMLTPDQAQTLAESKSVVSVFESKINKVSTTHSWEFLRIDSIQQYNHLPMDSKSNVIVGVVDTGIWPESESFSEDGFGPVPTKFQGECVTGENFTLSNCNRKIIGARFYFKGFEAENGPIEDFGSPSFRSARDSDGHGTHTASTVAGSVVADKSLFGIGAGTARGGAPSARLAIYKACWFNLCSDADLLSALDDAIHDGVDILSLSLGPDPPQPGYFVDAMSVGAFHAFQKGILVSTSAGNSGLPQTATNVAPWILSVAASTMDRELRSNIYLGNSKMIMGFGINPRSSERYFGLITASAAASPGVPSTNASFCKNNTLDSAVINGKIVVCTIESVFDNRREKAIFVNQGGGVGMILIDPFLTNVAFQFVIPTTFIGQVEAQELQSYMAKEKNPVAKIQQTNTVTFTKPAPKMAVFSSMGPNIITPDILKPDITAPGVNVLAAWSPVATETTTAHQSVNYNIISGTSMACPHVSAVAVILKSLHPYWSPAAIKSAIMTTATVLDNNANPIQRDPNGAQTTPFDYGSGHLNPVAATDPGLIYDFDSNDIIEFLCSTGATPLQLANLTTDAVHCKYPPTPSYDFNYPSIGVSNMTGSLSVHRTVTYYGEGLTVYYAQVDYPSGVKVTVTPNKLKFSEAGQKMSFKVDFTPYRSSNGSFVFGALTWSNGHHTVRSPIGLNVLSV
ncbi:subtilisin-like serine-protease S [Cornus florida]|uniref:subtilisin-like serine-protease S n=1 Tax=Cornus florida TaxID=4283 RepID=UPI00289EF666|nr:subtilisin-like serine-protease S [Cornus florida]